MAMETTAIRFAPDEKAWIQSYADFCGRSFSDVVREAILEKVEDAADFQAYTTALEQDDGIRYTTDEVTKMALETE